MSNVVCATRAGQGSRAAQLAAIEYARQPGKELTFLYVIDINSMGELDEIIEEALRQELLWMGKTLLRIAEMRADQADLRANLVIREGSVRDEICDYVTETQAELLLLGAPRGTSANVFGDDEIEKFAGSIEATTGVPVRIVRPESLASTAEGR